MFTLSRHAILLACGLALASWLLAQGPTAQIDLNPASPGTNDTVIYKLSGVWRDGCIPEEPALTVDGYSIRIDTTNSSAICTQALTPWTLAGTIGKLAAGSYQLVVTYSSPGVPTAIEIERKSFTVTGPATPNERILPVVANGSPGGS